MPYKSVPIDNDRTKMLCEKPVTKPLAEKEQTKHVYHCEGYDMYHCLVFVSTA
jgi:hypothetical protein